MKMNRSCSFLFVGFLSALMVCQSVFAQVPTPQFPTIKQAQRLLNQKLAHAGTIKVRMILNDLLAGDFVTTLEIYGKADQPGAQLEIFADQTRLATLNLKSQLSTVGVQVNMRNGLDYQRLVIRSVGKSDIQVVTANIGDPNGDTDLPPPPPPPDEPPPIIIIPQLPPKGPPGLNEFNANCKTRSSGVTFYDNNEGGAVWFCKNAQAMMKTHPGECEAMAECRSPEMKCSTSSNGVPVIGYEYNHTVHKCQAHPSTNPSECADFIRCEGGGNGPPPVINPNGPTNFFDAGKPCQTKSNGYKFSSFFLSSVINDCQSWSPLGYTNAEQCQAVAFCNGNEGQVKPHPGGGGHVGPLPGGHENGSCRTESRGRLFVGDSRFEVVSQCKANQFTVNSECEMNVNNDCGMHHGGGHHGNNQCFAESRGYRFFAQFEDQAASQCRAHPQTSNSECDFSARQNCF